jgi:superfamily II RNA helicase
VERLFQAGLVKVVFATETLAAGINMPARTTILSSISKRGDHGHRTLTASEFLQMSGRAGRRGMDPVGHVAVMATPHQTRAEAQFLAGAPPDPLASQFTPTYGMVLNLLQRHGLQEAEFLISRSFGQFLEDRREERRARSSRVRRKRREREGAVAVRATGNWQRFLGLRDVLTAYGYLDDDRPSARGLTAAAIRAEHELLVAEALCSGALDGLPPSGLAAVATALVAEELRPSAWVKVQPTGPAVEAIREVSKIAREIRVVQRRCRIDVPTRVFADCSGLTQSWAEDGNWELLGTFTSLDEGDVVRVMRRTVDLLEQIRHAPGLDDPLRDNAKEAIRLLDREPVKEVL